MFSHTSTQQTRRALQSADILPRGETDLLILHRTGLASSDEMGDDAGLQGGNAMQAALQQRGTLAPMKGPREPRGPGRSTMYEHDLGCTYLRFSVASPRGWIMDGTWQASNPCLVNQCPAHVISSAHDMLKRIDVPGVRVEAKKFDPMCHGPWSPPSPGISSLLSPTLTGKVQQLITPVLLLAPPPHAPPDPESIHTTSRYYRSEPHPAGTHDV